MAGNETTSKDLQLSEIRIPENNGVPNNANLPALVYKNILGSEDTDDLAEEFEKRFRHNGWGGCWRWGVYDFHHYHSKAYEVLGVARGRARLRIGGPDGELIEVEAGDMLLLPPGTGHKNEGSSSGFQAVGAYPHGQEEYDMIRARGEIRPEIRDNIAKTPVPASDPFFGAKGPALEHWQGRQS
mgnify:FL=1